MSLPMNPEDSMQKVDSNISEELRANPTSSLNMSAEQLSRELANRAAVVKLVEKIEKSVEGLSTEKEKVRAIMKFFPDVIKVTRNKASAKSLLMRFAEGNLLCKLADVVMFRHRSIQQFAQLDCAEIEKSLEEEYNQTINDALAFSTPYDFNIDVDLAAEEYTPPMPQLVSKSVPVRHAAPYQLRFGYAPPVVNIENSVPSYSGSIKKNNVSGPLITMEEDTQLLLDEQNMNASQELKQSLDLNQVLMEKMETREQLMIGWQVQLADLLRTMETLTAENLSLREELNLQGVEVARLKTDMSALETAAEVLQSARGNTEQSSSTNAWIKDTLGICGDSKNKGLIIPYDGCEMISGIEPEEATRKTLELKVGYSLDDAAGVQQQNYINKLPPDLEPLVMSKGQMVPLMQQSAVGSSKSVNQAPSAYSKLLEKLRTSKF